MREREETATEVRATDEGARTSDNATEPGRRCPSNCPPSQGGPQGGEMTRAPSASATCETAGRVKSPDVSFNGSLSEVGPQGY